MMNIEQMHTYALITSIEINLFHKHMEALNLVSMKG